MAVNKNFVIKNGVEVAENLIFASSDLEKVGIGSTVPNDTLDVRGGIAATNFYAAGVVTSTDNFYVGASGTVFTALTGFGSVGVGTANPIFPLDIRSSASTGTTALYVYGDMRLTGDITADDISIDDVNATDLNVSGLSTLTGNVVLAGSVNQLNVSGISTFADDVIISGGGIQVTGVATFTDSIDANAGLDVDGQADLDEVVVAGVSSFSAYPSIDADNEIQVGTAIQLGKAGIATALGLDISTGGVDIDGQTDLDEVVIAGVTTASDSVNVSGGTITVGTGITIAAVAGFATFSSGVKLKSGDGGVLSEGISSVTAGFDNTSDLNLDNGMVHYTSDALAGNANTLNITSSVGINTAMAVNDMIVVTGITSVSSTSHYVNALTIDHNPPRQISWVGGAAPTAGGSTGFDTYTFTIWKTGNGGGGVTSGQFMVIANHTTTTA